MNELQNRMSSKEFGLWMAFNHICPGEPERGDYRHALVASTIANFNRKRKRPFEIKDFLLKFESNIKMNLNPEQLKQKFMRFKDLMKSRIKFEDKRQHKK